MNKKITNLLFALFCIILCGLFFYVGANYAKSFLSFGVTSDYRIIKDDGGGYLIPTQTDDIIGSSTVNSYWKTATTTTLCLGSDCQTSWPSGGGATDQLGQIGDVSTLTLDNGYSLFRQNNLWTSTSSLFMSSTGNIGIGTTSPYAKLSVWGTGTSGLTAFNVIDSASTTLFSILDNGNVGIASSSPFTKLGVIGNAYIQGNLTTTGTITLNGLTYTFPSSQSASQYLQTNGSGALSWATIADSGTLNYGAAGSLTYYPANGTTATGTTNSLLTWDNTNARLGIGTTSPYAKLSIHANNGETNTTLFAIASSTATATTSLFTVLNNGNVGIGTAAPSAELQVYSGSYYIALDPADTSSINFNASRLYFKGSTYAGYISNSGEIGGSGLSYYYNYSTNGDFAFKTNALERMRIASGGNIGIGTTSPYSILSISNSASTAANTPLFTIASTTAGVSTSTLMTVLANGSVGIGTAAPQQKLHVEGQCVTGDSELITEDGKKLRIDQVRGGEYVLSLNEKTGKLTPAKIKGLLDMGIKPIYEIETEDGKKIRTTGNHPYLVKGSKSDEGSNLVRNGNIFQFSFDSKAISCPLNSFSGSFDSSLEKEANKEITSFCGMRNQTTEKICDFRSSQKSESFVTNTLRSFRESEDNNLSDAPGTAFLTSQFCESNNLKSSARTFSSSSSLGLRVDDDIVFLSNRRGVMQSSVNMLLGERWKGSQNFVRCFASRQHIQNLPDHNSSSFESGLSMADGWISDDVFVDNDSHKNKFNYYDNNYSNNDKILSTYNVNAVQWTKVAELKENDEIAVADENLESIKFSKIKKINILPAEQVYDIEVEGTHNFVANGIIAHNTYISGNVGIGTTSPYAKLSVVGQAVAEYFTATSTTATSTFPYISMTQSNVGTVVGGLWQGSAIGDSYISSAGTWNAKEPAIAAGISAQYWRGDKTWQTLDTSAVSENTNLYYTDVRSRLALSSTANGLTYTNGTGVFSLTANYLIPLSASTTNWNTFYDTPSNRITAGTGLSWNGNTLNTNGASGTLNYGGIGSLTYYPANGTTATGTTNSLLTWDNTNARLGIGTTSPYSILSISNSASTAANTPLFTIASTTAGVSTSTLMTVLANGRVGIGTVVPSARLSVVSLGGDTATYGADMVTNGTFTTNLNGWTVGGAGTGWTYSADTASHSVANTDTLYQSLSLTANTNYVATFTVSTYSGTGVLTLTIGNYDGNLQVTANGTYTYFFSATTTESQDITFTPTANFVGKIDNVSVVPITGTTNPTVFMGLSNSDSSGSIEMRSGGSSLYNSFIGYQSGLNNTTGSYNSSMGYQALMSNITGVNNSAMGYQSLRSNTTGSYNSAMGCESLRYNTTGADNSAMGVNSLYANTTGADNSAMGYASLRYNTTGSYNSAMGRDSLRYNTTGAENSAVGVNSLRSNTTGAENSAVGRDSLYSNTTGTYNSAVGVSSLYANTTGSYNSAMGYNSLYYNQSATSTTAIGAHAAQGSANYSNQYGTYIGYKSGFNVQTGSNNNSFLGYQSGLANTTGANNLFLGYQAGDTLTTGSNNIVIGYDIHTPAVNSANTLNIGNLIFGTGIDGTGTTLSSGKIGIGTTSPQALLTIGSSTPAYLLAGDKYNSVYVSGLLEVGGTGTSTIASNLYVVGTLRSTTSYTGDLIFANNFRFTESATSSLLQSLKLQSPFGETVFEADELGNISIGTTTADYKLNVGGDIAALGFINISTRNAKENVVYLQDSDYLKALEVIGGLNVATYNYKGEETEERLGLIAEDSPREILSGDGKGVDLYKLSSFTLAGIKALNKETQNLKLKVQSIEDRVAALENGAGSDNGFEQALSVVSGDSSLSADSIAQLANNLFGSVIGRMKSSLGVIIEKGLVKAINFIAEIMQTKKLVIDATPDDQNNSNIEHRDSTIGEAQINQGEKDVYIINNQISTTSKIFITPQQPVALGICEKHYQKEFVEVSGSLVERPQGFRVCLKEPAEEIVKLDWWIVETVQNSEVGNQMSESPEPSPMTPIITPETTIEPSPSESPVIEPSLPAEPEISPQLTPIASPEAEPIITPEESPETSEN